MMFPLLSDAQACAVTGATSLVGCQLVERLLAQGKLVHALGRGEVPRQSVPGYEWHQCDLTGKKPLPRFSAPILFHVASIWLLPDWIEQFHGHGVRRIIAFSSTSRLTKADSSDPAERKVAESLARSEASVANACERLGIAYTIFRPTLIYGAGRDRNISDIARIVKRFGVFPILGNGIGLRQPVHSADLAQACILAGDHSESVNRIYNLSGGETLAYREMVQRIFRAMDKRAKIVSIPEPLFRLAIRFAKLSPRFKHLKPEMAKRMDRNLCFDHLSAVKDFGYAPRPFLLDRDELGLK